MVLLVPRVVLLYGPILELSACLYRPLFLEFGAARVAKEAVVASTMRRSRWLASLYLTRLPMTSIFC